MNKKLLFSVLVSTAGFIISAEAQVLMLNFRASGAPDVPANSPYHTSDPSFTDTTWNNVSNADVSSGLLYADGSTASGVGFNLGVANLDSSTVVDLSANPGKASNLGSNANTGVYAGNSVGVGGIFDGIATDRFQIGLQVTGLAAGTYEIYITGRNTNGQSSGVLPYTYYAGAGSSGSNFDFSGYANQSITFPGGNHTDSWVEAGLADANYGKLTVTISAGEALNIVSNGDGGQATGADIVSSANRGFLNSVQIVSIPEPSTWALIVGMSALVAIVCFKRRR